MNCREGVVTGSKHYSAVVLSPHLDDAVFSCGGEIARIGKQGHVLVINIFTRYLSVAKKAAVVLSPERYSEEEQASEMLGYEYKNLDELDAYFRLPQYQSIGNIFRRMSDEELPYLNKLKKIISDELGKISFDRIYVPMGIGWHVDHCLTHLAMQAYPFKDRIYFYEDVPYCFIDTATGSRFFQINSQKESFFAYIRRWLAASRSFYKSGMVQTIEPAWQRYFSFPVVSGYLFGMMKSNLRAKSSGIAIDPEAVISDISDFFDLKIKTASLYKSQVKEFYCSLEDMRNAYSAHSARLGFPNRKAERYWRPVLKQKDRQHR